EFSAHILHYTLSLTDALPISEKSVSGWPNAVTMETQFMRHAAATTWRMGAGFRIVRLQLSAGWRAMRNPAPMRHVVAAACLMNRSEEHTSELQSPDHLI